MIDEKALIKAIKSGAYECEIEAPGGHEKTIREVERALNKMFIQIVNDQPLIDEWIPCSERLPEAVEEDSNTLKIMPYIITFKSIFDDSYKTAADLAIYVKDRGWVWFDEMNDIEKMDDVTAEVVAWKELPRPYKR